MSKILAVDPKKCTGCRMCEAVCSLVKRGATSISTSRIKVSGFDSEALFNPVVCMQCELPYCVPVCPADALRRNSQTGVVELIEEKCVGCKVCVTACPFGAIGFVDGVAIKCDLCGGEPTCVSFCKPRALTYVELDDVSALKRTALTRKIKESLEGLS